ncbi:MAG TPA: hypothetical protein VH589_24580 [Trebonia sp.]|jgi:hypothetical protein
MSALVLDAGALIAIDRGDAGVLSEIAHAIRSHKPVRTNAMAIAQVWRDGKGRQARLARVLRGVEVEPITREDGFRTGELLGTTGMNDPIDASVALLAGSGDRILTSDQADLRALCDAARNKAVVVDC